MSDVGLSPRSSGSSCATGRPASPGSPRFKIAVVAVFSASFWVTLFELFYSGMAFLQKTALQYNFSGLIARCSTSSSSR